MPPSMEPYTQHLATFALVGVRVAALVMVAPVFGTFAIPVRVRALLALALTVLVVPIEVGRATAPPETIAAFLVAAGGEALVGLTMGVAVRLLFCGLHVAGQIVSQMSGMQLADVFDPGLNAPVPIFSRLLLAVATAVFLTIGGHRLVIEALLDTFAGLPAGQGTFSRSAVEAVTVLFAQSFVLGVRAAAPAIVALLLATLILGLVSRTLPQLNVMALGFGVNATVALVAIGISLGGACWIFQGQIQGALETALYALRPQ
jgi:flagellar biosynthesis protein FliR